MHLIYNCLSIRRMMQYPKTINMIKTLIVKWQPFFRVSDLKSALNIEEIEALLSQCDRVRSQIEAHVSRSVSCKLKSISSNATTNLQHVLPSEALKMGYLRHMPVTTLKSL